MRCALMRGLGTVSNTFKGGATMDPAEAWLREHDLEYASTSVAWRHISETGEYRGPRDETPWGDTTDLEVAVMAGGKLVEHMPKPGMRICWVCENTFAPREAAHRCCSETCRAKARRDYKREQMRERRKAA